jgi:hypothetical protein
VNPRGYAFASGPDLGSAELTMSEQIRVSELTLQSALVTRGLDHVVTRRAVEQGLAERRACTGHDPATAGGSRAHFAIVRTLRDRLVPLGWRAWRENGLEGVESADGRYVVLPMAGDPLTGTRDHPRTKYARGTAYAELIQATKQTDFIVRPDENGRSKPRIVVVLLHHAAKKEVRFELSVPRELDRACRIGAWGERWRMDPIVAPPEVEFPIDDDVDFDIDPVRRRG